MIKIVVVSYNNQAPPSPVSALFGQEAKTFGRSDDNFFVLPDPKHMVSRKQATVRSDGLHHVITSLSHANPVVLNGREIDAGREYELTVGDEIQVGLYVLRAETHLSAVGGRTSAEAVDTAPPDVRQSAPPAVLASNSAPSIVEPPSPNPVVPFPGALAKPASAPGITRGEPLTVSPAEAVDPQEQAAAFLRGAGLPATTLSPGLTPELLELLGKVLATAVQGTIDLSALRALIKREVRAEVTMVVVKNNNPIKFFPDAQTVMTQMLRKKMPGFMGPVEAMEEAYEDLHAHQLGVIAGMRALIADLLARFDPTLLEKKQPPPSFFGSTAGRKAKMWDAYQNVFQRIDAEIKDNSQTQFGEVFLDAYEAEVDRFKDGNEHG